MSVKRFFSGAPWETKVGYCRALRNGQNVYVSGTAPIGKDGNVVGVGDAYAQTKRCLEIIEEALTNLNCPMAAVVRTRMFVTDISLWSEYGKAHKDFFGEFPPTTSMVEVKSLIDPAMLIEIEVDALINNLDQKV
jgi:isochorismate pyruvate lyase